MKYAADEASQKALGQGRCPGCGAEVVDLRGTSRSQETLRAGGRCCGDGQSYECNEDVRKKKAASTWK